MNVTEEVEDQSRARLAYCLTQWKRPEGGDIPQSEEGIAEHQQLVDAYEAIYGPANPNSLKQYASVYGNIRIGIQEQLENDAEVLAYKQREIERKEREAAEARIRSQELMDGQRRAEAERILSMNAQSIPLLQMQVDRLTGYTTRDAARAKQLQGMLDSDRFKDSYLRGQITKNLTKVQERYAEYSRRLAKFEDDVKDAEAENDWARDVLGQEKPQRSDDSQERLSGDKGTESTPIQEPEPSVWRNKHPFYEAVNPSPFDKVVVVDKPGDRRIKIFTDAEADTVLFKGLRIPRKRPGLYEVNLTPEQFAALNVRN